jgi:hypothetical protein
MGGAVAVVVGLLVLLGVVIGSVVTRVRRRNRAAGPDQVMRAARRAIRGSAADRRRRTRGSLRGKGQGGIDSQAFSEASSGDSGGGGTY